jgi:broad specificity phosphatase PhoE
MTGLPLVKRIGVPIAADDDSITMEKMSAFLSALRGKHSGDKAVLIVGHSNTIPLLLMQLGAKPDCYDRLGIVKKGQGGDQLFLIEGHDGLWKVDLKKEGCEALTQE